MALPVKKGISAPILTSIPKEWSSEWFRHFVTSFLHPLDVRAANPLQGQILQTSDPNTPASFGPGQINPSVTPLTVTGTQQGILAKGNIMPFVQNSAFTYTSDTTDITFTWPGYTVYRPDGTSFVITAGNQAISGLSASTTYNAYAYSTESAMSTVVFVSGLSGQVGTPAILFPPSATYAQTSAALAQASTLGNIFQGKLTGITTSSGGGGGGGGGGGYGCPHPSQIIETSKGTKLAGDLRIGDELRTPNGWSPIIQFHPASPQEDWILWRGTLVTPLHRFMVGGELTEAWRIGQDVRVRQWVTPIALELEDPHLYYFYQGGPLSHNLKP